MTMYRCNECGHLFESGEERIWLEDGEEWSGCPICGESYDKISPCRICGGYENKDVEDEYCSECREDVRKKFKKIMKENFSENEFEILDEIWEGFEYEKD